MNARLKIHLLAWVVLFTAVGLKAGNSDKRLQVHRTDSQIQMDGVLDEPIWQEAEPISGFVQQEPLIDVPASERTEVRAILTSDTLFFGVTCFDSEPDKIIARERRRDDGFGGDDRFEIIIDTFHDHRNGYHFITNPLGARFDALVTDEGIDVNREWDERWWVQARVSSIGWTAEIAIPLSSLRSNPNENLWGVNFRRFIRRKSEISLWTAWDRDFGFVQVSQIGHLGGLSGARTGLRVRVQPYLLGGFSKNFGGGTENESTAGLEVAKFGITSSLIGEVTANTDFAQVEVDEAVVNLTRFPLFFPERREFFLERSGVFEFGVGGRRGGNVRRQVQMFFPRRIGLTEDRRPVPMLFGSKLTGRLGNYDLGVLNAQTDDFEDTPGSNYSVIRLKRNILERSNLGMFFSGRQSGQEGDSYNRVAGGEANFTFLKNFDVQGFAARSFTQGIDGDEFVGRAKINWFTDLYEAFVEHLYVGDDFRHDVGFVRRPGIRRTNGTFVWEPRIGTHNIRNLVFRNEMEYVTDTGGRLLTRVNPFRLTAVFQNDDRLFFDTTGRFEQLDEDFEIADGIVIPAGNYSFREQLAEHRLGRSRKFSIGNTFGWGSFFGGDRRLYRISPSIKLTAEFSAEASYEFNDVDLPQGEFRTHLFNGRFNFNWTNRWLTTAVAEYDSESDRVIFFFRLRFIYRPGDDLFVVFNQTSGVGQLSGETDRTLLVKFTRSFDF